MTYRRTRVLIYVVCGCRNISKGLTVPFRHLWGFVLSNIYLHLHTESGQWTLIPFALKANILQMSTILY